MPRRKKIIFAKKNLAPEKTITQKPPRIKQDIPYFFATPDGPIAKKMIIPIIGLLSALVVSIIFIAAFSLAAINSIRYGFGGFSCCQNAADSLLGSIIYGIDKNDYKASEEIKVSIDNNSNKAIYLAPCRYFNKFQKKSGGGWQNVFLETCDSAPSRTADAFEKIPGRVEDEISAARLGAGIWRGVSGIYFDCREARPETCANMRMIYTGEFKVE